MSTDIATERGATISRRPAMSFLLGLGLESETLHVDKLRLRYNGLEWRWIIWRLVRVDRTVHLRDITGLSKSFGINPLFVALAFIALVNALANLVGIQWWFELPFWQLPFLGFIQHALGMVTNKWLVVHLVTLLLWSVVAWLSTRTYLAFNVPGDVAIHMRVDGVSRSDLASFNETFQGSWGQAKDFEHNLGMQPTAFGRG